MQKEKYLFGPFIGEAMYELSYFVGHAIYLRKKNPRNEIIVLTRREHFDLYGKYATTLLPLPLSDELIPSGFNCTNMRANVFDQILHKFEYKYRELIKIDGHFYPHISSYLRNIKWYYPREEVDFDFKPRLRNKEIAQEITSNSDKIIISSFHKNFKKLRDFRVVPIFYLFKGLDLSKVDDATALGVLIEMIRLSNYVFADIDSIEGRLAMLIGKPLITKREVLDAQYLNPINPYSSIVLGCQNFEEALECMEAFYENNL